jgi:preprotein translocase subunit SecG|tara:strand:+ start:1933 stop:2154 length:222 start_codon:yes stop_codon:yes gene_type:complete
MDTFINILMIVLSVVLVGVILMQVKGQGTALFGAAESSYRTRRGIELLLFRFTIVLVCVFILVAIVSAWMVEN